MIWQFTGIWNEYLFGVVFTGGQPAADHRSAGRAGDQPDERAPLRRCECAVLIGAVPPLLIYFFGGKYFVRGLTQGAIK